MKPGDEFISCGGRGPERAVILAINGDTVDMEWWNENTIKKQRHPFQQSLKWLERADCGWVLFWPTLDKCKQCGMQFYRGTDGRHGHKCQPVMGMDDETKRLWEQWYALKQACAEYHQKHHSGPGGSRICTCGAGCGGSPACSMLAIFRDWIRYGVHEPTRKALENIV